MTKRNPYIAEMKFFTLYKQNKIVINNQRYTHFICNYIVISYVYQTFFLTYLLQKDASLFSKLFLCVKVNKIK